MTELIPCPWKNEDCEHNGRVCEQGSFDVCPEELKQEHHLNKRRTKHDRSI